MAEYKRECLTHKSSICTQFCTACKEFKCSRCKDEHIFKGNIVPEWLIDDYIYEYNSKAHKVSSSIVESYKKEISKKVDEYIEIIKKSIGILLANFDIFDETKSHIEELTKKLNEMGMNDLGYTKLNACAEKYKGKLDVEIEIPSVEEYNLVVLNSIPDANSTLIRFKNIDTYFARMRYMEYIETIPRICNITDSSITLYNPRSAKFIKRAIANKNMTSNTVVVGSNIYCIKNTDSTIYNLEANTLSICQEINYQNLSASFAKTYDRIFVLNSKEVGSKSCWQYNITCKTWQIMPSLNEGKLNSTALAISKCIYLFAWKDVNGMEIKNVEKINYNSMDKWKIISIDLDCVKYNYLHSIKINANEGIFLGCDGSTIKSWVITFTDSDIKSKASNDCLIGNGIVSSSDKFSYFENAVYLNINNKIFTKKIGSEPWYYVEA